jgi:hypothetical protein
MAKSLSQNRSAAVERLFDSHVDFAANSEEFGTAG